ncbi:MGDG synthase family glycosyltransferase [Paenibacillus arenilitoris]|uniref:UDP-N-acetylglucosamine 2-epimerase n=1 Tax=Paenibacillus arenilitoris TaxID=2772299 RepID=A0A927H3R8_9BACL|nr:glycosyltransferase [Paenibacillus arenilitoris]MBD2867631.1 UDP-N-acetylglucosamine 2-epimerase [Paenibacillus arenilitoris]
MHRYRKLVILTASYGDGHLQVSRTLKDMFARLGYPSVKIIDLFQEAHPFLNAVARFAYLRSPAFSALGFDYYGWSYYFTRNLNQAGALAKGINRLGVRRLIDVVREEDPAALVLTFPFGGIAEKLREQMIAIPIFTVITDFGLHNRWLHTDPERFYVATDELKQRLIERGVRPERIAISGIPVREDFAEAAPACRTAPRSILVLAGAHGLLPEMGPMIMKLLQIPEARVTIVCGKNDKLKRVLEEAFGRERRVRLLGYVHELHRLMRKAACVVTKAGGIRLSEAICLGAPILIYRPFPGQERENALYLEEKGAAFVSHRIEELKEQAERLLDDPSARKQTLESLRSLDYGQAAHTIAADILRTIRARAPIGGQIAYEA